MNRKNFSKTVVLIAVLLAGTAAGTFCYVQSELRGKDTRTDLFSVIPGDCEAVLEINNVHHLVQTLHYTSPAGIDDEQHISSLMYLLGKRFHDSAGEEMHSLNGQINHMLVSFHAPGTSDDQVIYGHLGKKDKGFMDTLLLQTGSPSALRQEVTYHNEPIYIYSLDNKRFLSCYFQKGFCAISLQKKLVEKVIDTYRQRMVSVRHDSVFARLLKEKKPVNSLCLYVKDSPQSDWTEQSVQVGRFTFSRQNVLEDEEVSSDVLPPDEEP